MIQSLSALLPVFNAQATLIPTLDVLLETLPEVAESFDILVMVNGATDATTEVMHDMAGEYPQLRYMVLGERAGTAEVLRRGLNHTPGQTILFRDEDCPLNLGQLHKLLAAQSEASVTFARRTSKASVGSIPRLPKTHGHAWSGAAPTLMLFPRRLAEGWLVSPEEGDMASLARHIVTQRVAYREVELGDQIAHPAHALFIAPGATKPKAAPVPRRPSYLKRLREFALGE